MGETEPAVRTDLAKRGTLIDVRVTWGTAVFSLVLILAAAVFYGEGQFNYFSEFLICGVLGMTTGWLFGIFATPYNRKEKARLSDVATAGYGFFTGFIVSKIDGIVDVLLLSSALKEHLWVFVSITTAACFTTFITTYINRSYWLGDPLKPSEQKLMDAAGQDSSGS